MRCDPLSPDERADTVVSIKPFGTLDDLLHRLARFGLLGVFNEADHKERNEGCHHCDNARGRPCELVAHVRELPDRSSDHADDHTPERGLFRCAFPYPSKDEHRGNADIDIIAEQNESQNACEPGRKEH